MDIPLKFEPSSNRIGRDCPTAAIRLAKPERLSLRPLKRKQVRMLATKFDQIQKFGSCHLNISRLQREPFNIQLFVQHLIEGLECTLFLLQVTHHLDLHTVMHIIIDVRTCPREKTSGTSFNRIQMHGNVKTLLMWLNSQSQTSISFDLLDFKAARDFRMYFQLSLQVFEKLLQHRLGRNGHAL